MASALDVRTGNGAALGYPDPPGFHSIDTATAPVTFTIHTSSSFVSAWDDITYTAESEPGTELGVAQQVNFALPVAETLKITFPELATDDYIDISEVWEPIGGRMFCLLSLFDLSGHTKIMAHTIKNEKNRS